MQMIYRHAGLSVLNALHCEPVFQRENRFELLFQLVDHQQSFPMEQNSLFFTLPKPTSLASHKHINLEFLVFTLWPNSFGRVNLNSRALAKSCLEV